MLSRLDLPRRAVRRVVTASGLAPNSVADVGRGSVLANLTESSTQGRRVAKAQGVVLSPPPGRGLGAF